MSEARLANLLGATAVALADRLQEASARVLDLGGEAPAAILTVGTRPGEPIESLRRSLGLSHSGTVRLVDRLEGRGWVQRRPVPGGRAVRLDLTRKGRSTFDALLDARRACLLEILEPVPARDRAALGRALSVLLAALPGSRDEARRICRLCEHAVCRGEECPVGPSGAIR